MFNLTYDNLIFKLQKYGGVSTYWNNLIPYMKNKLMSNFSILESNFANRFIPQRVAGRGVFHSSYFNIPVFSNTKNIITVHDLIYEKGLMGAGAGVFFNKYERRKAINNADAIVCISQNTYHDMVDYYNININNKPIKVIYHGIDLEKYRSSSSDALGLNIKIKLDAPFFLFVGGRGSYKNFQLLVESFPLTRAFFEGVNVFFTGSQFSPLEMQMLELSGLKNTFRSIGNIESSVLKLLYRKSLGLIYPSSYEGFGLPLIEAMASECPIIASSSSCIPEIVMDAGLLFVPGSAESLAECIDSLLDFSVRSNLISLGTSRVDIFDLKSSLDNHFEFYRQNFF